MQGAIVRNRDKISTPNTEQKIHVIDLICLVATVEIIRHLVRVLYLFTNKLTTHKSIQFH